MRSYEYIFKLFQCEDEDELKQILNTAIAYVEKYESRYFTIEHIVYGCMKYYGSHRNAECVCTPVNPSVYARNSGLNSQKNLGDENDMVIVQYDVMTLSEVYNKIKDQFPEMTMCNNFYYILAFLNNYEGFIEEHYIPSSGKIIKFYPRFSDFLIREPEKRRDTVNSLEKRIEMLLKNKISIANMRIENEELEASDGKNKNYYDVKFLRLSELNELSEDDCIDKRVNDEEIPYYSSKLSYDNTIDITTKAYNQEYSPTIGRDKEISRTIDILTKVGKNNVALIGMDGVGKNSIVYGLAQRIVHSDIPHTLEGYHILQLNLSSMIAQCAFRNEFENNFSAFLKWVEGTNKKIIVFIDDLKYANSMAKYEGDFVQSLKPILLNPKIKVIFALSFKEYKKIERDKGLSKNISTIIIEQPSDGETYSILYGIKNNFEKKHNVVIPEKTLKDVIILSKRYVPERYLPEKAIDILDEACACKVNSVKDCKLKMSEEKMTVLTEDILICISHIKNIPLDKIQLSYNNDRLEDIINKRIIGQEQVITKIAQAVRRAQAGLNDEERPIASFMFIGPTGVGKTEVAKTLADVVFTGRDSMIRFDMSEYSEAHTISKLIGSPPGYIGYDDAGQLTEKVKRKPYSLVLFDEIEKAHSKVWNLLLQILDEGVLTDSHGENINFKNTIIVLTSNAGVRETSKSSLGFVESKENKNKNLISEMKKVFPPEFLNRLDEIVIFNNLSEEDTYNIAKLCIDTDIIPKLKGKGIKLVVPDDVIKEIAHQGYNKEYGAREIKRIITRKIKNPLAEYLIKNQEESILEIKTEGDDFIIVPKY